MAALFDSTTWISHLKRANEARDELNEALLKVSFAQLELERAQFAVKTAENTLNSALFSFFDGMKMSAIYVDKLRMEADSEGNSTENPINRATDANLGGGS